MLLEVSAEESYEVQARETVLEGGYDEVDECNAQASSSREL